MGCEDVADAGDGVGENGACGRWGRWNPQWGWEAIAAYINDEGVLATLALGTGVACEDTATLGECSDAEAVVGGISANGQ